jgi:hypothetical protein
MFVQVIEGKTSDPQAFQQGFERWQRDLRPGAIGYLGSTEGVTDGGEVMILARFADRESAMANSERPEQGEWWNEMEALFEEPPRFHESSDVVDLRHGDRQRSGFVQVMEGHVTDRARAQDLEARSDEMLTAMRPDLLGLTTAYFDDGDYATVAYFTSEREARRNESIPIPENLSDQFREWESVMPVERYIDIRHPMLVSSDS